MPPRREVEVFVVDSFRLGLIFNPLVILRVDTVHYRAAVGVDELRGSIASLSTIGASSWRGLRVSAGSEWCRDAA